MKISPARKSAFEILLKIEREKAYSSILLPLYEQNLDERDSSLCHQLTLGILRNKIYLDRAIETFTKKRCNKFDLEVLIVLRLGLYQLIFLDKIPAYSAINESVNLSKFAKKRSASGLVNAVLRKASKNSIKFDFIDETERVSIENSHPRWLLDRWIREFGFSDAEAIAKSNNTISRLTFRFTKRFFLLEDESRKRVISELKESDNISESELVEDCFVASKSDKKLGELADENLIYFQEEASQLTARLIQLEKGERFLDVCASPGSKATYIEANCGFDNFMIAGDLHKRRVQNLVSNSRNQGAKSIKTVRYDAEKELPFRDESFDIVLVDAPCSGTGTIRRNPEIRYSLEEKDFEALHHKQLNILKNASKLVKRGGKIIYSTCSIESEENEEVIESFVSATNGFSITAPNVKSEFLTESGFARTFPHRDNIDGFFIASLENSDG